jgi:hypothetical protein
MPPHLFSGSYLAGVGNDLPPPITRVLFPSRALAAHLLQELAQSVQLRPEPRPPDFKRSIAWL